MNNSYFHQVHAQTPTRFWVNNPTLKEAALAIEAGAEYCTTNPTYASKMLNHPEMKALGKEILNKAVHQEDDDSLAASLVQSLLAEKLMHEFKGVYEKSGGRKGWVSIQGDPVKEDDPSEILREAGFNRKLGANYIAKIPVTASGIEAIRQLAAEGVPIIATEVMSLSQAVNVCEAYTEAVSGLASPAPIYVTHITGIFDESLMNWKKESGADVDDAVLAMAGFLTGKKQYQVLKERQYPVVMLGGGARGLHHFTDFVGADMHITINWKGTADKLIEHSPPVEDLFSRKVEDSVTAELLDKVPDFKAAWDEDGLSVDEYGSFPPVMLFRSMFLRGWEDLEAKVREARREN